MKITININLKEIQSKYIINIKETEFNLHNSISNKILLCKSNNIIKIKINNKLYKIIKKEMKLNFLFFFKIKIKKLIFDSTNQYFPLNYFNKKLKHLNLKLKYLKEFNVII